MAEEEGNFPGDWAELAGAALVVRIVVVEEHQYFAEAAEKRRKDLPPSVEVAAAEEQVVVLAVAQMAVAEEAAVAVELVEEARPVAQVWAEVVATAMKARPKHPSEQAEREQEERKLLLLKPASALRWRGQVS